MTAREVRQVPAHSPSHVKAMYGMGGMADTVKATASGLYLLFFYTTVLGLPARLVGLAAAIGLLWDSFIDPYIGRLSDRTRGPFGRRHGWMLAGTAGMGIGFVALFAPPAGLSTSGLFLWLLFMSLLLRTSQSAFSVPYLALGADLDTDYHGRTTVAGYRAIAGQVGAILASGFALAIFFPAAQGAGSRLARESYVHMGLALGLVLAIACLIAVAGTWHYRLHATDAPIRRGTPWKVLLRNAAFVSLIASTSLYFVASIIATAMGVYFLTYYAGIERGDTLSLFQFALYAGAIAGVTIWARVARRIDKHRLHFTSCLVTGTLVSASFWVANPDGIAGAWMVPVLVFGYALVGATGSALLALPHSMLADVIQAHEERTGERAEGAIFGAFSCALQVSAGVAMALAALLIDYGAGVEPGTATQSAATITRIGILASLLPGMLMIAAGLAILPYSLTRARVVRARIDLAGTPPAAHLMASAVPAGPESPVLERLSRR